MQRVEREFAGRKLIIETGRMARQAHGSCLVQYGETTVLCAATVRDEPTHLPFFPMTVEYREKTYAAGKYPGGFIKREGRPSDNEILTARIIDRSLRPLFPDGFLHETQMVIYVVSADQQNNADMPALFGSSLSMCMSKIPFDNPVAGVRIGRLSGQWVLNPTFEQLEYSDVDMIVVGTEDAIMMVEGGALEVPEEDLVEALAAAHEGIKELIGIQKEMLAEVNVPTMEWSPTVTVPDELRARVEALAEDRVAEALALSDKQERNQALAALREDVQEQLVGEYPEEEDVAAIKMQLRASEKAMMRRQVLEKGERIDGRGVDDVRPISCEVGLLPRTHGSALFTRGQTQALAVTTLGTSADEQRVDSVDVVSETSKSFMLHYNFPPFCTGEAKPIRGTSRREIGHGNLAERAIQPLLPAYEDFPYTLRVVSEVLESNGSSSMASVCGASLSLMDAGVPLKAPCAGVAMGLIKEGDKVAVLTDILGVEDALGDMDFKVAGTRAGVTSIQMDIKVEGLTLELMKKRVGAGEPCADAHPGHHGQDAGDSPYGAERVRATDHHDPDQPGEDRGGDRSEGEDDPGDPGGDGGEDRHRGQRSGDDLEPGRRGWRAGAGDDRGHRGGARSGADLRRRGEDGDVVRRLRGDPAGDGGAVPHLGAPGGADGADRGRARWAM
jgi:polyribonucleotide nucleotidyltransferase